MILGVPLKARAKLQSRLQTLFCQVFFLCFSVPALQQKSPTESYPIGLPEIGSLPPSPLLRRSNVRTRDFGAPGGIRTPNLYPKNSDRSGLNFPGHDEYTLRLENIQLVQKNQHQRHRADEADDHRPTAKSGVGLATSIEGLLLFFAAQSPAGEQGDQQSAARQ